MVVRVRLCMWQPSWPYDLKLRYLSTQSFTLSSQCLFLSAVLFFIPNHLNDLLPITLIHWDDSPGVLFFFSINQLFLKRVAGSKFKPSIHFSWNYTVWYIDLISRHYSISSISGIWQPPLSRVTYICPKNLTTELPLPLNMHFVLNMPLNWHYLNVISFCFHVHFTQRPNFFF